jgi:hypothetical protein
LAIDLEFFGFVLFVGVAISFLLSPVLLSRLRLDEERKVTPLSAEWCNIRRYVGLGTFAGGNIFFWRLSLYPEFMVTALFSPRPIPYRDIERVEMKKRMLSREVWVYWHLGSRRENFAIRTRNAEAVVETMRKCGINVINRTG